MSEKPSQAETNRQLGKFQLETQKNHILDVAEKLFLEQGIENTSISQIAEQAGVTRITVYRYFGNRDEIAVEIHARMFEKINILLPEEAQNPSLESQRQRAQTLIRNFSQVRDAFRYIGMFDKIYMDQAADTELPQWALRQLKSGEKNNQRHDQIGIQQSPYRKELTVLISTVIWFLEKLALRGELTWSDRETPLEQHLQVFEEIIMGYFDRLIAAEPPGKKE